MDDFSIKFIKDFTLKIYVFVIIVSLDLFFINMVSLVDTCLDTVPVI